MKRTPVIKRDDFETEEQTEFFVDITTLLGMRYYPSKLKNGSDRIGLLFIFTDKLDPENYIYSQLMFDLDDEKEKDIMKNHPQNITNWDKEFIDKHFLPIISGAKPGVNSYGTNMVFSTTPQTNYYQFECVYTDNENKANIVRKVNCSKALWLQLSQFIYWFLCGYPVAPDIFLDTKYKNAKICEVTGVIFDGSCHTVYYNTAMIMAHFTLHWKCGIETGTFSFNVPCAPPEEAKIERRPISNMEYIKLYSKDDTVSPDRLFSISSPERLAVVLSGNKDEKFYRIYTLSTDIVNRVHWLDWGKHIFINIEDKEV